MRKLILEMQLTADGYVADVNDRTDWQLWNWDTNWNWDDKLKKYFTKLQDSVDCILLSRKMAKEGFISHWKQAAANTHDPRYAFAKKINTAHKVVFSKTLDKSDPIFNAGDNISLAKGDLAEEVNRLKSQKGKNIIVYGGATFVSSLIKAGLIDEFQFFINPTAIGKGKTIFQEIDNLLKLALVKSTSYDCGIVVTVYKPNK